jgi:hypothetical protein
MAAGEFVKKETNKSKCSDQKTFGNLSTKYDYVVKGITGDSDYPSDACEPWLHYNMRVGNIQVDEGVVVQGRVTVAGVVKAPTFDGVATGNKVLAAFDIPHVTQNGKRIRHIVAEGPEPGIYIRGKLKDSNVIELPEYWDGLIDPETITVTLTQIGYSQDLIVDKIEWGKNIIIRSGVGANIHCYYEVWAARWVNPMDHSEKLHIVYEGESPADYPGENESFLIGGWDYDKRNTQWENKKENINNG